MQERQRVVVTLERDEALVLFDWLASRDAHGGGESKPNPAEQQVLWKVEGQLEAALPDGLAADYRERVVRARRGLVERGPSEEGSAETSV
jgi:hypothetical protein